MATKKSTRARDGADELVSQACDRLLEAHSLLMLVVGALQDWDCGRPVGTQSFGVLDAGHSLTTGGAQCATRSAMAKINGVWDMLAGGIQTDRADRLEGELIDAYGLLLLALPAMPLMHGDKIVGCPAQSAVHVAARMVAAVEAKLARTAATAKRAA
jgi:hypothetical protein